MFEFGQPYGIILIMVIIASAADILLMAGNVIFRRDFLSNFAKHGISVFKLLVCVIFIAFFLFVLISSSRSETPMSSFMVNIHIICTVLLFIDLAGGTALKLKYPKKPRDKN
jgi:hypothetical protein